jgi:steroid delta-isomerase-like uncharacterized protein
MKRINLKSSLVFTILFPLFFLTVCQTVDVSREYKPLLKVYLDAWNNGNLDGLNAVVSPDFELRMSPSFKPMSGIDSLKKEIMYWRTAYPDFHITVDEEIYCVGRVAVRWTINATNTGQGRYPPTGKKVVVPGMSIFHISGGKIIDEWIAGNNLAWFAQMGYKILPPDEI